MDLTLTIVQRDLQAALRDYLRKVWTPDRLHAAALVPVLDRIEWQGLADMGVFRLVQPEERGGMGLGMAEAVILYEELGRALVPGPLVTAFLAADLVSGAADGSVVVTSADSRDPFRVVEHAGSATDLVVVADEGLVLIPMDVVDAAPVSVPLDPMSPISQVRWPEGAGRRIGTLEDAARWRIRGTLLTSALQVGVAQGALDLAVRYAGERVQFDRVIGSFQAVKHLLADALVKVDLARAAVLVGALRLDDAESDPPAGSGSPAGSGPIEEAVSVAKVLADDAGAGCGRCGVQVHGGMGFTWEVLAHFYLKRAWVLETGYGSADEHAARIAAGY